MCQYYYIPQYYRLLIVAWLHCVITKVISVATLFSPGLGLAPNSVVPMINR